MKRILLLADANSAHTRKWATGLAARGFEAGVFSLRPAKSEWWKKNNVTIFNGPIADETFQGGLAKKAAYLKVLPALKRAIRTFSPQLLHAHYASSYGLLGRLSGFHPFVISAWGSDVMDFPSRNFIARRLLRSNLAKADAVMATSPTIEKYIHEIVEREVIITPFGVDPEAFQPMNVSRPWSKDTLVIGAVKSLEAVYALDVVIDAYVLVKQARPGKKFHLLFVGEGSQREQLEEKVKAAGLENETTFAGSVDFSEVPQWHNRLDVFMNISAYESFGVSVLEAMACGKPVIVTDTGGLADLVEQGREGFRVPLRDARATADAILELAGDENLRAQMGKAGREKVLAQYTWEKNLDGIVAAYERLLQKGSHA